MNNKFEEKKVSTSSATQASTSSCQSVENSSILTSDALQSESISLSKPIHFHTDFPLMTNVFKFNQSVSDTLVTSASPTVTVTETDVIEYLKRKPTFLKNYIIKNIDGVTLNKWISRRNDISRSSCRRSFTRPTVKKAQTALIPSAISELTRNPFDMNEKKFEAIKGIANAMTAECDSLVITQLFRECVMQSTHADVGFIFMANLKPGFLSLLDPAKETGMKHIRGVYSIEERRIPAATAAATNEIVLVRNLEETTDYQACHGYAPIGVRSVMAIPITKEDGSLVAALEVYALEDVGEFQPEDIDFAETYAQWSRTTLTFSSIYTESIKRQKVNNFIFQVAQTIFSKISTIDEVMLDIVSYAKALVRADRGALFLLNEEKTRLEPRISDSLDGSVMLVVPEDDRTTFPITKGILGQVAQSGNPVNLADVENNPQFNREVDSRPKYTANSLLCMPVKVKDDTIGVIQMINCNDGVFPKDSEDHFESFAVYCGLAIHVASMYQDNIKSRQQCKATLEVMSLHTQCTDAEVKALKKQPLPRHIPKIASFSYSPWSVPHEQKIVHVIYMFQDLFTVESFTGFDQRRASWLRFDINTVLRFVLTARKNYRSVPYHNWDHAVAVNQAAYVIIKKCSKGRLALEEELAMFIAALCHDIDHRGKTNQFMIKNQSPLAGLYSTSTMEQHHFNLTVTILQRDGHNIFQMISSHRYSTILALLKTCILATDLLLYFDKNKQLNNILDEGEMDFTFKDNRMLLICNCMTACDLCAMYKPWNIQFTVVLIIMKEFWLEGDEEKRNGRIPIPMMDRDHRSEMPESQVGFISFICLPCFKTITRVFPEYRRAVDCVTNNLEKWKGLTRLDEEMRLKRLAEMELKILSLKRNLITTEKYERNVPRPSFQFASHFVPLETVSKDFSSSSSDITLM